MSTPQQLAAICVYCGSSNGRDLAYVAAARVVGELIAASGRTLVYGGATVGTMGVVADAALAAGGPVHGVITQQLVEVEVAACPAAALRSGEGRQRYPGINQSRPYAPREPDSTRGVAVHAQRPGPHCYVGTVHGGHQSVQRKTYASICDLVGIVQHRTRLRAGDQSTRRRVRPIGERFRDRRQPCLIGGAQECRTRQAKDRERAVIGDHGGDHRRGLLLVVHDPVVERAMRLEVAHPVPGHPAEAVQRAELVQHLIGQLSRGHIHRSAAEPGEIAVGHLRAD